MKESNLPLVSIILATYNRAHILGRAIDSVLRQTYPNFELIIIDDGSTDNTSSVLQKYSDPRIRIFKHEFNMGVTAAKNSGLRQIRGDWFSTFDSDDEMLPDAISSMMDIPLNVDKTITSVTCNCYLANSNEFSGKGLDCDSYIKANEIMPLTSGDFWGMNKTSLLNGETFNDRLNGIESTLWYKINERAKTYYLHKALNIIHLEGADRVSIKRTSLSKKNIHYANLVNEKLYLQITKKYKPIEYCNLCKVGMIVMRANKNKKIAAMYYELLKDCKKSPMIRIAGLNLPSWVFRFYLYLNPSIR